MAIQFEATVRCNCGKYLTSNEYYFYKTECTECVQKHIENQIEQNKRITQYGNKSN